MGHADAGSNHSIHMFVFLAMGLHVCFSVAFEGVAQLNANLVMPCCPRVHGRELLFISMQTRHMTNFPGPSTNFVVEAISTVWVMVLLFYVSWTLHGQFPEICNQPTNFTAFLCSKQSLTPRDPRNDMQRFMMFDCLMAVVF